MNYDHSNSHADLAARIRTEHDAASSALKDGLRHAIAAGQLLIEAKAQLKHGLWSSWLTEHCSVSERTAQAYMRVARSLRNLESVKAQRVADLSFRDTLQSLAEASAILKHLPRASRDRALEAIDNHDNLETFRQAVRRMRSEDKRAQHSLESHAMLPPPHGRDGSGSPATQRNGNGSSPSAPISPSRPSKCENASPAKTNDVQELSQDHDGLIERAGALEAEAKALRDDARSVNREIVETVRELVGPVNPFTETYDFECEDEAIVAELAALSDNERADRLLSARGAAHGPIRETERGYWGDMNLASQPDFVPAPGGAWTGVGSPEWLDELFPGLRQGKANDDDQQRRHGRPAHCASTGSRQAGVPAGDARRWSH